MSKMIENEQQMPKSLEDCKIDFEHYLTYDENNNPIEVVISKEEQKEWLLEDCECDEQCKADKAICKKYFSFGYDVQKLEIYYKARRRFFSNDLFSYWGLINMFNDGWLITPAYVNWREFSQYISTYSIKNFIHKILDPRMRIEILNYIINDADNIFNYFSKKSDLPTYKSLLLESKEAAKIYKQNLKKKEAEEKEKAKKSAKREKPEYSLSVEEIIQYVREENPDAAPAIRGMLRYFADEKDGWNSKVMKALLEPIKAQNFNFYAPVENAIGNVEHINTKNE